MVDRLVNHLVHRLVDHMVNRVVNRLVRDCYKLPIALLLHLCIITSALRDSANTKGRTMEKGQIVKFSNPSAGEENARFFVVEDRGPRVLVRSFNPEFLNWQIKPTFCYDVADLTNA